MKIKERNINGNIFNIDGDWEDKSVYNNIINDGDYENHMIDFYKMVLKRDSVCFDVGANVGIISMYMSLFTDGKIYAFEPIPETFEYLKTNIGLNSMNVVPINKALGDFNGEVEFVYDKKRSGDAHRELSYNTNSVKVVSETLDKFTEKNNITKIDLIKMDVEGFEQTIVDCDFVKNNKPDLVTEYCPKMIQENLSHLTNPSEMYFNFLQTYYKNIYFIERPVMRLKKVNTYDELVRTLNNGYNGIGDVYATNKEF